MARVDLLVTRRACVASKSSPPALHRTARIRRDDGSFTEPDRTIGSVVNREDPANEGSPDKKRAAAGRAAARVGCGSQPIALRTLGHITTTDIELGQPLRQFEHEQTIRVQRLDGRDENVVGVRRVVDADAAVVVDEVPVPTGLEEILARDVIERTEVPTAAVEHVHIGQAVRSRRPVRGHRDGLSTARFAEHEFVDVRGVGDLHRRAERDDIAERRLRGDDVDPLVLDGGREQIKGVLDAGLDRLRREAGAVALGADLGAGEEGVVRAARL